MRHWVAIGVLAAAALLAPAPAALAADVAPAVKLAQGRLAGTSEAGIERFFDIPFAAAPVGPLRWRAPQAAPRWTGVRGASNLGPACPQTVRPALVAGGVADRQSEDCLQLNIWRPKGARKLPVMVWIHGGAHVIGSGTFPAFDGTAFARQGVILVTINYRLGSLGYFAHPSLSKGAPRGEAIANYGLMDQLAALRWVRKNIAAFGGDPHQVTLFGESAGAIGVTTILALPEAKGLFARAIVQSGVGLLDPRPLAEQEALGAALALRAGARIDASPAELRALPAAALVAAGDVRTAGAMTGPILDGKLIREAPWRTLSRAEPVDVPLLVGANSNEASVILAMGVPPAAALDYLGPDPAAGRAAYGAGLADDELARQILGDAWFVAPARWLAARTARGAPSYLYHFGYVAAARRDRAKGAAHGSEIPYLFGTLDYFAALAGPVDEEDRRFGEGVSACWIAFAKTGVPRCALVPDWPRYSEADDRLAHFAPRSSVVDGFRKPQLDHLLKVHFGSGQPGP
ncbi:carboxylesterase/lipase family protein [Sphingopyxis macrogoltabida]|uniref:carboxylesterase/lipase family protein n=1 Tax=Sphingopyxis macrogoltabida TaxID=33050 RepID=UPI000B214C14|nr:carboxylesterase family protein [Sphingopyxis macrogoltabida]